MSNLTKERNSYKAMLYAVLGIVDVERDVGVPENFCEISQGWEFNIHTKSVYLAWSTSVSHGSGIYNEKNHNGIQGGRKLFSTKEKAMQAMISKSKLLRKVTYERDFISRETQR